MASRPWILRGLMVAGLWNFAARAEAVQITDVSVSGSAGTATTTIDNSNPNLPQVNFEAIFNEIGSIDFTVSLDGPGTFFLTNPSTDNVTNRTGTTISALQLSLISSTGSASVPSGDFDPSSSLPSASFPDRYSFRVGGSPGLAYGQSSLIGIELNLRGTGPQTAVVRLTSFSDAAVVPEPSVAVLCGSALVSGLAYRLGTRRRRA